MQEPIRIALIMEGGLIQQVLTAGVPVEVVIVDYDTEGADAARIVDMPQHGGGTAEAYLNGAYVENSPEGRAFTLTAFDMLSTLSEG